MGRSGKAKFVETYFSSGRKIQVQSGVLRFIPRIVLEWYFARYSPALLSLHSNYAHFVPNPSGMKVLEIGFGEGRFMEYCGKENVAGVDLWLPGVRRMKEKGFHAVFADAAAGLPFRDGSFDLVYSEQVIEHVWEGQKFLAEIRRVLKKGGKVVLRTMDFARAYKAFYSDYTHIKPYTKVSLYKILEDSGFEVKEISNGFFPGSFLVRRLGNLAVLLPKSLQNAYLYRICPHFSPELYAVAVKK